MKTKSRFARWLGVLAVTASFAPGLCGNAKADTLPSMLVTFVATNSSGINTSVFSANLGVPLSSSGILITIPGLPFTTGGQAIADNNAPGQLLQSTLNSVFNTNPDNLTVTMVVSALNFKPGGAADTLDNLGITGQFTGAVGSSI